MSVNTGRFIGESTVILSCIANFPSIMDGREVVVITWFGPSGQLGNSSSVTVSNVYAVGNGVFQSILVISSFAPAIDNGEYICNATMIRLSSYVIGGSGTGMKEIVIGGCIIKKEKYIICIQ